MKDLKSKDPRMINLALSFIAENPDKGLYSLVKETLMIMAKGSSRDVSCQKKAICCLSNFVSLDKDSLKEYLQWLDKNLAEIQRDDVVYCVIGVFETVIRNSEELTPFVVKPIYSLFEKDKNWIKIKLICMLRQLFKPYHRFISKCQDKIYNMLTTTTAKSVECELIKLVVEYYEETPKIYNLACDLVMAFLEAGDINQNI